jgi:hypothetical protein
VVRRFCKYRLQFDSPTEIPATGLFGRSTRRLTPHIYETSEIEALLAAAAQLSCVKGLRGATYATLFGLLAAPVSASRRRCRFGALTSISAKACLRSRGPSSIGHVWYHSMPALGGRWRIMRVSATGRFRRRFRQRHSLSLHAALGSAAVQLIPGSLGCVSS